MIVYLHITKAGGTTMLNYLEQHCKTLHMKSWWRADWIIPEDIECLFSHCPYGKPDKHAAGEHEYMTFLRDPVDRMLSYYYFSLQGLRDPEMIGFALGNFINIMQANIYSTLDNGQVRLIAGRNDMGMIPPESKVTEDDLERAKKNLLAFDAIGTLDTFDEDLAKFAKKFGWKDTTYKRYRTGRRPPLRDIHPGFIEIIKHHNKFDQQLFDFAKEEKWKINQ